MMFVSGETAEPSADTTWMIEEIVREQVIEMLKEATALANRRGSKSISTVDLIFQIRHNAPKVSRLKTFLSWKDVRKNVKDSDDKGGGDGADVQDFDEAAAGPGGGGGGGGPAKAAANKKAKLILPWEVQSFYAEQVPEREDEEDEEEEEQNEATLARLASADERTRNMTREEYVYWSDCRQASFTFRKGKRFREWAGFGTIIDSKPNDDVVDILGFLTFEIVQTLTEEALKVKAAEDTANKKLNQIRGGGNGEGESKKRKREGCTLFEKTEEGRTPVEPKHVREAFRRLQTVPKKYTFMRQGFAGVRTPLRLI
jgi:transcription initiation protein SPT3